MDNTSSAVLLCFWQGQRVLLNKHHIAWYGTFVIYCKVTFRTLVDCEMPHGSLGHTVATGGDSLWLLRGEDRMRLPERVGLVASLAAGSSSPSLHDRIASAGSCHGVRGHSFPNVEPECCFILKRHMLPIAS